MRVAWGQDQGANIHMHTYTSLRRVQHDAIVHEADERLPLNLTLTIFSPLNLPTLTLTRSTALKSIYQNMLGPILPRRYAGPNENYTDSTNIKKRRQRTVEMGCTNWEAGLTSSDISVSPSTVTPRHHLLYVPQASKSLSSHQAF